MLKINFKDRITLKECFEHPWLNRRLLPDELKNSMFKEKKNEENNRNQNYIGETLKKSKKLWESDKISFRSRSYSNIINEKEKIVKLPSLMTKFTPEFEENMLYDYNFSILRQFNGKIPNFLMPIGHSKKLKQKNLKIINFISNGFETVKKKESENNASGSKKESNLNNTKHKSMSIISPSIAKNIISHSHNTSFNKLSFNVSQNDISLRTRSQSKVYNLKDKSLSSKEILISQNLFPVKLSLVKPN